MLSSSVLVLNRLYQAITFTTVRRAFLLLYRGHGRAVTEDYATYDFQSWVDVPVQPHDDCIHTPTRIIKVPRVILLATFDKIPRQQVKFTRKNIYLRDKNRCQYCGRRFASQDLNLDHVVPLSRGGKTCWENVVCSCVPCNTRKGNHPPERVGMRLIKLPVKPAFPPLFRLQFRSHQFEIWKNFLDQAYWNTELEGAASEGDPHVE